MRRVLKTLVDAPSVATAVQQLGGTSLKCERVRVALHRSPFAVPSGFFGSWESVPVLASVRREALLELETETRCAGQLDRKLPLP
jgi:hypothetical protein